MNTRRRLLQAALILALGGLAGTPAYAQDGDDVGFPRDVTDATGAPITIPARPQIVAVVIEVPALAMIFPAESIRRLNITTGAATADWAGVGLLVVPDLYATAYRALIAAAEAAGVPVFQIGAITRLSAWRESIERLGQATGQEERASETIRHLEGRLRVIHALVHDAVPVRALALTPEGYTFGQETLFTELVEAAGGINVAAEAGFDDYRQVDDVVIRELAPDAILLSPAWSAAEAEAFAANPAYTDVPAVRDGRVYRLPFSPTLPADPGAAVVALAFYLHLAGGLGLFR
jgi:ABC-type Fe3+-hydroxamate transport system substrate-binding protein